MFKLVREYFSSNRLRYLGWSTTNNAGQKPAMKRSMLNQAIDNYKETMDGGVAVSKKTLCHEVNLIIKMNGKKSMDSDIDIKKPPKALHINILKK